MKDEVKSNKTDKNQYDLTWQLLVTETYLLTIKREDLDLLIFVAFFFFDLWLSFSGKKKKNDDCLADYA